MKMLITLLSTLILCSCSVLSPIKAEPETTYELNALPSVGTKKSHHPTTLLVLQPEANFPYNSTQMIYTIKPYETHYFAKNRWTASPAAMLQPLIVQTLQNTHHYRAIVTPPFSGYYQYALNTQLLELRQDFACQPSKINLTVRTQLISGRTGKVIATQQFSIVKTTPENTPYGGVIAANQATAELLGKLARFCLRST